MKLAIATDFFSPWIGGPATFVENFCAYLSATTHQVSVIAPSTSGRPGTEHRDGFSVYRMPTVRFPVGYQLRALSSAGAVGEALARIDPDVLQVHHPFPIGLAAVRAARRLGIPVVAVNHTIPECSLYGMRNLPVLYPIATGAFRRYLVWFLRQAAAISTPTATAARLVRGMGLRRPVAVISNGIDTQRFAPSDAKQTARDELGLPQRPTVLYTGRLDAEKDMPTWIRAAALALREADAQLVIGGEGAERPALQALVRDLGIAARVTFPGYLPSAQLPRLYAAADVYCMTSAVELQSISTLEAMASGLPVVAAAAGALPELVEDGKNGYLAPPGNVQAFARGLASLLQQPALARAMGLAGRQKAEEHSLGSVARRHEQLLVSIAQRNQHIGEANTA